MLILVGKRFQRAPAARSFMLSRKEWETVVILSSHAISASTSSRLNRPLVVGSGSA